HPAEPAHQSKLATTMNNLAILRMDQAQLQEARRLFEQAVRHQQQAVRARPRRQDYRWFLCNHTSNLAHAYKGQREARDAEKVWREAVQLREKLANDYPDVPLYRKNWAADSHELAQVLLQSGRLPQGTEVLRQ